MTFTLEQFIPSLNPRDAVGVHTLRTHEDLLAQGHSARIWGEEIHPELRNLAKTFRRFRSRSDSVLMYQASTGSTQGMWRRFAQHKSPKVLCYHNITPAHFFAPYDESAATNMVRGREQLGALVDVASCAIAMSEFNASELRELGMEKVLVAPPYLPPMVNTPPSSDHLQWLRSSKRGTDFLFVGRVVPNKGHAALIKAFTAFQRTIDQGARLFMVGAWGHMNYMNALFRLRENLRSKGVIFTGRMSDAFLAAHYQTANAYVSMSQHEGFGLPLIEAMRAGLITFALDAGAVSETLGGAGVLLRDDDPRFIAEALARVLGDHDLVEQIKARQQARVKAVESAPRSEIVVQAVGLASG